ncbi:MAG: hypothetical protein ACXWQO_12225, partial [Bdellovibrionota bacterium]
MKKRSFLPIFAALLSLSFLSGVDHATWRKIACIDPSSEQSMLNATSIPLENDLFVKVRSESEEAQLRKGALDFYNLLSRNELNYYLDAQAAEASFGIKTPLFNFSTPSVWSQYQNQNQSQSIWGFNSLGFNNGPQLTNLWGWNTTPSVNAVALPVMAARASALQPNLASQQ